MQKLPEDCDLSFLQGVPLDTIDFGLENIHFWFHNGAKLTVSYRMHLRLIVSGEEYSWRSGMMVDPESSGLLKLIQKTVDHIDVHNQEDIDLKFSNGASLLVLGTDKRFECYSINYNDISLSV